jgi:DNA-directed DNA polymerase III PolC
MPCHLHTHSYFSFLEALPSPLELVQAAQTAGMPALALTDHNNLTGSVEFFLACQKAGIKPLIGLEIDLCANGDSRREKFNLTGNLVLLVMNRGGWSNLCRLCSHLLMQDESPVCSMKTLAQYSGGLLALTGGRRSLVDQFFRQGNRQIIDAFLSDLSNIFPNRLYVELQKYGNGDIAFTDDLANLAAQHDLPIVATQDIFYLIPEQAQLQRTLTSIRLNLPLRSLPSTAPALPNAWFTDGHEMDFYFARWPKALAAIEEIVTRCQFDLPLGEPHYPQVVFQSGLPASQILRQKAEKGAREQYGEVTPELRARLDHELGVINERGFDSIFLIMEDILNYARQSGVPISSRGSAASSLVAHCLGITSPDPIRLNLYFERFLNPARATPPDIDTDLCSRRRDTVIQYVFDKYGVDNVAMVGTINRFRPRSALRETAKAHGLPPSVIQKLCNRLPYHYFHGSDNDEEAVVPESPFTDLAADYPAPEYQIVFREATALLKLPRHLSVHPGGIIISPCPIADIVPLQRSGNKGVTITQLDLNAVELLGLVKLDLLGIRGLTVLGDVADTIYNWRRSEYKSPLTVLDAIPVADSATAECVKNGRTIGCFQIESPGMRATLREIQANSIDDIMAALALYRPGPLQGGLKDAFVRRYKGEEKASYLHPALELLLDDTYGVILYQEQVLRIAHDLAGFSMADADLLRRAMSHFDPGKQMQILKQKFIAGAGEKNGVPEDIAEYVWELMAAFAGYGFPKAHAASYAQVAWRSAWCKTHFPAEFMAAVLANWGGYYSQRVYISEARRLGLDVCPPHINHSRSEFCVAYPDGEPKLYMGLDQVRDLSRRTQERIMRHRPFHSLGDFLFKVDPRPQEVQNLIRVGAFEGLGSIPDLLRRVQTRTWQAGQLSLFDMDETVDEEWPLSERSEAQEEILGISLDIHPLERYADRVAACGAIATDEAAGKMGERVSVAGVRLTSHRSRTAKGESMGFLTLEDLEGMLDVIVFPDIYRRYRHLISSRNPMMVTGIVELDSRRGEPLLRAEKIVEIG